MNAHRPRTHRRRVAGGLKRFAATLGITLCAASPAVTAADAAARAPLPRSSATGVTLQVDNVTPSTPTPTNRPQRLTVTLTLYNGSGRTLSNLMLSALRGDPITTQQQLYRATHRPSYSPDLSQALPAKRIGSVPAGGTADIAYSMTAEIPRQGDLCLCQTAIYPLWFTAAEVGSGGASTALVSAQTFVPSFVSRPAKVTVAWVWPLLDRPHRGGPLLPATTAAAPGTTASPSTSASGNPASSAPLSASTAASQGGPTDTPAPTGSDLPTTSPTGSANLSGSPTAPPVATTPTTDNVFLDDDLAREVSPGGRLDRALAVVEQVAPTTPLTLLVDPDLLDELAVMADGVYFVRAPGASTAVRGTGSAAAAAWLARLRAVLPHVELAFTPAADPDIESLVRYRLPWSSGPLGGLAPAAAARLTAALHESTTDSPAPVTNFAWPATASLSRKALTALARHGTSTVLLDARGFPGGSPTGSTGTVHSSGFAPLPTRAGTLTAALTSPGVQRWARRVTLPDTTSVPASDLSVNIPSSAAAIPQLVAEVALRAVQTPDTPSVVVIAPPRQLPTVDAAAAAQAITATTHAAWARPATLSAAQRTAVSAGQITNRGPWKNIRTTRLLPAPAVQVLRRVNRNSGRVATLFIGPDGENKTVGQQRLGGMALAVQRCESSSLLGRPHAVNACAHRLHTYLLSIRRGVHVVARPHSTYTLASQNASLPVTIANSLDVPVWVDIKMSTVAGVPGFTATEIRDAQVNPGAARQFRIPTRVDRTGRIAVRVRLTTRAGVALGHPVALSIHITALGTIGVVITVVAGVVLALALLVRVGLRLRRRTGPATSDGGR